MSNIQRPRDLVIRIDGAMARRLVLASGLLAAAALVFTATTLVAGSVTKPNDFANGNVADAEAVNENFDTLYAAVNDGQSGRPFLSAVSNNTTLTWDSATWTGVNNVIALNTVDSSGIALTGDDLTFSQAGHYWFSFSTNVWSTSRHMSLRLRKTNGTARTLILRSHHSSTSGVVGAPPHTLEGIISVEAGDLAELQFVTPTGTASTWGGTNAGGETPVTARLDVFRIR